MFDSQNKVIVPPKHYLNIENGLIFLIGRGDFIEVITDLHIW